MDLSKFLRGLWLVMAALFIGGCRIYGINPLAAGFLAACCLAGENTLLAYVGLMGGIAMAFPAADALRYGIIMFVLAVVLNLKSMTGLKGKELMLSAMAGLIAIAVNISVYFFIPNIMDMPIIAAEGAIVFSSSMIYHHAIRTVTGDYAKIATENEAAISVMALAATMLYGMPRELFGELVLAESFALFSILFAVYKFGFGIGISWTAICGVIMSLGNDIPYLTVWMLVTVISFALLCVIHGGRMLFAVIYAVVYYTCGIFFYDFLIAENSQKAVLSALLVFLLAPSGYMIRIDDRIKNDELSSNSPEWGRLIVSRVNALASAFKRIEYTLASNVNTGIGFNDVGEIIENFTNQLDRAVPLRKTIETKIVEELAVKDIQVKNLVLVKNSDDRYEVYITLRVRRGRLVPAETVKNIVSAEMGVPLALKDESRRIVSRNYEIICMHEKPGFMCRTAVRRMSRYSDQVSGDNFYIGDILDGQKLVMIADGMGNGEKASEDSNKLIDALEELLSAGFDKDISIRIVNSYLADKNRGESFATLDMLLMDMHTGCGRIYKQGAAATYIKRGEWLELIKSTSLPVGIIEGAVCEKCSKKFYNNDIIVMVSDGVLESIIFENKEDYMQELLLKTESDEPEDIAGDIAEQIKALSGNRLKDDATIIVCKLVKSL